MKSRMQEINVTVFIESPYVKSFLFECAKYWASEGSRVLYISSQKQLDLPPSIKKTNDVADPYAEFLNITFVTAPDANSLTEFLINLPKLPHIPKVLIIEDVTSYVDMADSPESQFLLICSLMKHIAQTCWKFHKSAVFLILSIKFIPEKLNIINFILSPSKIWKTIDNSNDNDKVRNFTLQEISYNPICRTSQTMEFSLSEKTDEQFLCLENIKELFTEDICNFNNKVF